MEVKINREIRHYTEAVFFGLSLRQTIFSILACAAAVGTYFFFNSTFGTTVLSWLCVLSAMPFVLFGFIQYEGMNLEEFIYYWLRYTVYVPQNMGVRTSEKMLEELKDRSV